MLRKCEHKLHGRSQDEAMLRTEMSKKSSNVHSLFCVLVLSLTKAGRGGDGPPVQTGSLVGLLQGSRE